MGRKERKYKRGMKEITVSQLVEKTGMGRSVASYRLRKWEEGKLEWEDLWKEVKKRKRLHVN